MKNHSNRGDSLIKGIYQKATGISRKAVQRVSYTAIFVVVLSLIATSYVTADSSTQVSLPGVSNSDSLNTNLLQGQKNEEIEKVKTVAGNISSQTNGQLAFNGTTSATPIAQPDASSDSSNSDTQPSAKPGPSSSADGALPADSASITTGELKSVNVASSVASVVGLSSANSVSASADSANVVSELVQASTSTVSKQQIVKPDVQSSAIAKYVVKDGDTLDSIASSHSVSSQTIRWANGLKENKVAVGATINIPAVDGVIHTVKESETLDSIVGKYKSNVNDVMNINDLDSADNLVGKTILLPSGVLPENERPEYVAPFPIRSTESNVNYHPNIGRRTFARGNNYSYGYCTWYVYNRRAAMGLPIVGGLGDARMWARAASMAGFAVNRTPSVGAVLQTTAGPWGHVAVVEAVNPDGSLSVSEMNYVGWNMISGRTIPASSVGRYNYIH